MPSITLWIKLYFPIGTEIAWTFPAVGVPDRAISHVSTEMFTSSSWSVIGTLFSFAHDILKEMWLHQAEVSRSHDGNSRSSVSTFSSSWRFVSSPSPLKVDILILSLERFFVYLKCESRKCGWIIKQDNAASQVWWKILRKHFISFGGYAIHLVGEENIYGSAISFVLRFIVRFVPLNTTRYRALWARKS